MNPFKEKDYKKIIENIRTNLFMYLRYNRLDSLIIGVSGGIDSAVCCALARPVCDDYNMPLIGRSIPIETNSPEEIERARNIGNAFCSDFMEVDMFDGQVPYKAIAEYLTEDIMLDNTKDKIRSGNLKARLRMIYLYDLAKINNGITLSTDNYTEYLLGFWTLHGDSFDYGMIQNLWKTEVYELAEELCNESEELIGAATKEPALRACMEAIPTDGLGITESDLDQIEAKTYAEVDQILFEYLYENKKHYSTHPIIMRHERTHFKRNVPINITRDQLMGNT